MTCYVYVCSKLCMCWCAYTYVCYENILTSWRGEKYGSFTGAESSTKCFIALCSAHGEKKSKKIAYSTKNCSHTESGEGKKLTLITTDGTTYTFLSFYNRWLTLPKINH